MKTFWKWRWTNRTAKQKNKLKETLRFPYQEWTQEIEVNKNIANRIWDAIKGYKNKDIKNSDLFWKYLLLYLENSENGLIEWLTSRDTSLWFSKQYDHYLKEDTWIICVNKRDLIDDWEWVYRYTTEWEEQKLKKIWEYSNSELSSWDKSIKSNIYVFEGQEEEKIYIRYNPISTWQIYISRNQKEI